MSLFLEYRTNGITLYMEMSLQECWISTRFVHKERIKLGSQFSTVLGKAI